MISSTMTVTASRRFPLVEAFLFSACVAWYIWQRQDYYQYSWIIFPVWLIASFAWNKDTLQSLGWRTDNLWSAAKRASVVFVPCALAILATGLLLEGEQHTLYHVLLPSRYIGEMWFWSLQEVGLNSLVSGRLLADTDNPLRV